MSKHNGNLHQTPNPVSPLPIVANQPQVITETPKQVFVVTSINDLIAQVEKAGGSLSPEAKAELEKMRTAQETLEAPKRLSEAETEVSAELPKLISSIAEKHKVSFSGRKVMVVFKSAPKEGEPNPLVSFGPEVEVVAAAKRRSGSSKGFKSHGSVILHKDDKTEIPYTSFGDMAKQLGLKMEGRANATVAITNPTTQTEWDALDSEGRKNLPAKYRIEPKEVDGKTIQHVYPISVT